MSVHFTILGSGSGGNCAYLEVGETRLLIDAGFSARQTRQRLAAIGRAPEGWGCRTGPSLNTRRLLVEEGGFLYDSDVYNDELPYWVHVGGTAFLTLPYTHANNDTKYAPGPFATSADYATWHCDAFDWLYREGAERPTMMSVGLPRFLEHILRHPQVWVCERIQIARHWHANHPAERGNP